ncbi:MAG TPA: hypothetical protein VF874_05345 [Mycobacterium sp.]
MPTDRIGPSTHATSAHPDGTDTGPQTLGVDTTARYRDAVRLRSDLRLLLEAWCVLVLAPAVVATMVVMGGRGSEDAGGGVVLTRSSATLCNSGFSW